MHAKYTSQTQHTPLATPSSFSCCANLTSPSKSLERRPGFFLFVKPYKTFRLALSCFSSRILSPSTLHVWHVHPNSAKKKAGQGRACLQILHCMRLRQCAHRGTPCRLSRCPGKNTSRHPKHAFCSNMGGMKSVEKRVRVTSSKSAAPPRLSM